MDLKELYRKILEARYFEQKIDEMMGLGQVHGTAHLSIGQEFIPMIVSQYLDGEDSVTSTHRGHSHALAKDLNLKELAAELMGKQAGYNSGKGGTQHTMSQKHNFYANGVTGGMAPIANGMALYNKQVQNGKIVVAYLGDGGINEGHVLESFNMAAALNLPVLFVCENNKYAMSTPVSQTFKAPIYKRAESFGIKSFIVERNDYKALDKISKEIISDMKNSPKPAFIEVQTYRHKGHSKNDKNLYRSESEEAEWMDLDILTQIEREWSNLEELNEIKKETEKKVSDIFEEVSKYPEGDLESPGGKDD